MYSSHLHTNFPLIRAQLLLGGVVETAVSGITEFVTFTAQSLIAIISIMCEIVLCPSSAGMAMVNRNAEGKGFTGYLHMQELYTYRCGSLGWSVHLISRYQMVVAWQEGVGKERR